MAGWWLPAEYRDAVEGQNPWGMYGTYDPSYKTVRYCVKCEVASRCEKGDPCWECGGEMTAIKPPWWPIGGANDTVTFGGDEDVSDSENVSDLLAFILADE